jgi:hypothetical protein
LLQETSTRSKLPRTLDNAGDGISSAFPKGKQNEGPKEESYFIDGRDTKFQIELRDTKFQIELRM